MAGGEYIGQPAIPVEMTERLREAAQANGHLLHVVSLAGRADWRGRVGPGRPAASNYNANATINSASERRASSIVNDGVLTLNGGLEFHGVIYHLNASNSCSTAVNLGGTVEIYGRIFIDGCGKLDAGSSKVNLTYDDFKNATSPFATYGTAGIVQNSWREIPVAAEDAVACAPGQALALRDPVPAVG